MRTILGHGEFARRVFIQVPWPARAGEGLLIYLYLQGHERVDEGFGARRAPRDIHIHWNITINPFENVVPLLERPAGNRASTHSDHIFWLRHLVVDPHDLRRHFLGYSARYNH